MEEAVFTPETLGRYLAARGLAENAAALSIHELGGGVSNIVALIEGPGIRWVVKQSLGKLRVKDDWRSRRDRIFREADAIEALGAVLDGAVPQVVHVDREHFLYVMTAAPGGSVVWKQSLLEGDVQCEVAGAAGRLLAAMIKAGQSRPEFKEQFADRTVFDELRIDPYYRTTAARHPDARDALHRLIEDSWNIRTALVHGDYSPKNMLVRGSNVFLIDFEVVHWGDPAFDSGFLLNHLMLKSFHQPGFAELYFQAARGFWQALVAGIESHRHSNLEKMTVRHLGGLMLARIDGKSPVEYLRDEGTRERARQLARNILLEPPESLDEAISLALSKIQTSGVF